MATLQVVTQHAKNLINFDAEPPAGMPENTFVQNKPMFEVVVNWLKESREGEKRIVWAPIRDREGLVIYADGINDVPSVTGVITAGPAIGISESSVQRA